MRSPLRSYVRYPALLPLGVSGGIVCWLLAIWLDSPKFRATVAVMIVLSAIGLICWLLDRYEVKDTKTDVVIRAKTDSQWDLGELPYSGMTYSRPHDRSRDRPHDDPHGSNGWAADAQFPAGFDD